MVIPGSFIKPHLPWDNPTDPNQPYVVSFKQRINHIATQLSETMGVGDKEHNAWADDY